MEVVIGIFGLIALVVVTFMLFFLCGAIARQALTKSRAIEVAVIVLLLYSMLQLITSEHQLTYFAIGTVATVSGYTAGRFIWRAQVNLDQIIRVVVVAFLVDNISSLGRHFDWKLISDVKDSGLLLLSTVVVYPLAKAMRYQLQGTYAQIFDALVSIGVAYVSVMLFMSGGGIYYFSWGLKTGLWENTHLANIYLIWLTGAPLIFVPLILTLGFSLYLFIRHLSVSGKSRITNPITPTLMLSGAAYFAIGPIIAAAQKGQYVGLSIFLYAAVLAVGWIGYWSGVRGILKLSSKWIHNEHGLYISLLVFFFFFGLTVEAQTTFVGDIGGFGIPYFEVFVLLGTLSILFGFFLGHRAARAA